MKVIMLRTSIKWLGAVYFDGFNLIFKMSVGLHGKQAQESTVLIDTTVQERKVLNGWVQFILE
jgi:hypothetical protein